MQPTDRSIAVRVSRRFASFASHPIVTVLYYLAVLLGLVALYGRGDFATSGFIYQTF